MLKTTKAHLWRELLWRKIVGAIVIVATFLSTASWLWDEFVGTERPKLVALLLRVPWYWWSIGGLVVLVWSIGEHAYKLINAAEQKLENIENARPKIKLKEPDAVYVEMVSHSFSKQNKLYTATVPFLKIRLINDPDNSSPSANANGVRATIDYHRCSDNAHVLSIDGRWAETDQPTALSPLASKSHLLAATFGLGEQRSLDIAYRDGQTGAQYAWNNDNYNYDFFVCPKHLLDGTRFRVNIRLRGDWVDEQFSFIFRLDNGVFVIEPRQQ